jgi:hypothetical protein
MVTRRQDVALRGPLLVPSLSGIVVSANVRMRLMKTAAARSAFVNWSDCEARLIAPEGGRARVKRVALASRPRGGKSNGTQATRAQVSITHTSVYVQACNLISSLGTRRDKPGIYGRPRRMKRDDGRNLIRNVRTRPRRDRRRRLNNVIHSYGMTIRPSIAVRSRVSPI